MPPDSLSLGPDLPHVHTIHTPVLEASWEWSHVSKSARNFITKGAEQCQESLKPFSSRNGLELVALGMEMTVRKSAAGDTQNPQKLNF